MKLLLLLLALLISGLWAYHCVTRHAPDIEQDITARTTQTLSEAGYVSGGWNLTMNVSGRDVTLSGVVPQQPLRDEAGMLAREVHGVRVVKNLIDVVEPEPIALPQIIPDLVPESTAELDVEAVVPVIVDACQKELAAILETNSIYFDSAKASIKAKSLPVLDKIVAAAKQCDDSVIHVHGHTDSSGDEAMNSPLSDARARAVGEYMRKNGVQQSIKMAGHGSAHPIASNDTREGRAQNRRIEFKVYKTQE